MLDITLAARNLAVMAVAYGLAVPIGWNREQEHAGAGLRTFPLVAVASCGFVLVGRSTLGLHAEPMARVIYGLMTGIGFIGGGAILKNDGAVQGTATAASLWTTGAIGGAVAFDRYEIAALLTLIVWLTFRYAPTVKPRVKNQPNDRKESNDA